MGQRLGSSQLRRGELASAGAPRISIEETLGIHKRRLKSVDRVH